MFAVVAEIIAAPIPIWTPMPTWAVAVATAFVVVWVGVQEKGTRLKSTTVAAGTFIVALVAVWLVAVGVHDETEWVPVVIGGSGATLALAIHDFLIRKRKLSKAEKHAGGYSN